MNMVMHTLNITFLAFQGIRCFSSSLTVKGGPEALLALHFAAPLGEV